MAITTRKKDPKDWEVADASEKLVVKAHVKKIRMFYEGDHWQQGEQYIGPFPDNADTATLAFFYRQIARMFTSKNAISEIINRRAGGVIGKEPMWTFTPIRHIKKGDEPTQQEQAKIERANATMTKWWNDRDLHGLMENMVITLLQTEHSTARFLIPESMTEEDGASGDRYVDAATIEEALEKIWVEHPDPYIAIVWEDPKTKIQVGIYDRREEEVGQQYEIVFLDGDETVLRLIGTETNDEVRYKLDRKLLMYTMDHRRFISEQIIQLQNSMNLALTMMPQNMTAATFLERVFLNAQAPGDFEYDAHGKPISGTFKPGPYQTGPNTTNFVRGIDYDEEDTDGNIVTRITTPDVKWRDPTPISPLIEGKHALYADILDQADQTHFLLAGDSSISGKSKVESRAEFLRTLRKTSHVVNACGRWIVETAMALAEEISNSGERFTDTLRVDFNCRLDPGPISSEEQKLVIEAVEKRIKPLSYGMAEVGIDDTDAALAEIAAQPGSDVIVARERAEVMKAYVEAGTPLEVAAFMAGIRGEDIEDLDEEIEALSALYGDGVRSVVDPETDIDTRDAEKHGQVVAVQQLEEGEDE